MRDKIIKLLKTIESQPEVTCPAPDDEKACESCKYNIARVLCDVTARKADYLIANGIIAPPCKVGDVVYVITDCSRIMMYHDNDYLTGTGAIECPFENACKFKECNDENTQVIETCVSYLLCDDDGWMFGCEHINKCYNFCDIGETIFLTKEEAEQKLKGGAQE